jgi:hypothetical protein
MDRCEEEAIDGYLTMSRCPIQAGDPRVPDYESKDGIPCHLDVYLFDDIPVEDEDTCDQRPFTSLCFLEAAGLIDGVYEGITSSLPVALEGYWKETLVCRAGPDCDSKDTGDCTECQLEAVFWPCEFVRHIILVSIPERDAPFPSV